MDIELFKPILPLVYFVLFLIYLIVQHFVMKIHLGNTLDSLNDGCLEYSSYIKKNMQDRGIKERTLALNNASDDEKHVLFEQYLELDKKFDEQEYELCCKFIKKNKRNLYAISQKAYLASKFGKLDEAIADYEYLIKKRPHNFYYIESCAKLYARLNNQRDALIIINNFYKYKQKDEKFFATLGYIFRQTKDYNLALKNYSEAIKLNPSKSAYYMNRAEIYRELNEMDKCKSDYNKLVELNNANKAKSKKLSENNELGG